MPKTRTQQEANEEVEREGYKLLSEYKGANSLVTLQCPNGHIYEAQFNSFHKGRRCKFCSNTNVKYVYEQVKEYVESQGDELLSTEYINNKHRRSSSRLLPPWRRSWRSLPRTCNAFSC